MGRTRKGHAWARGGGSPGGGGTCRCAEPPHVISLPSPGASHAAPHRVFHHHLRSARHVRLAAPPAYKQQPAVLCHARSGLGNVLAKLRPGRSTHRLLRCSITAAGGWRVKTFKWFQETIRKPNSSRSTPHWRHRLGLGVFRCQQDVLSHKRT